MESEIFFKILLTIVFGAILGLETETREIEKQGTAKAIKEEKSRIGGVRTYTVLSLFGGIAGIFYLQNQMGIVYILLVGILLFTLAAYILNVQIKHAFGLTTEMAIVITFILGFLTTSSLVSIVTILIILVLLTFFLSQKRGIGALIQKIEHKEIIDIIKFGLVSIVILPLLPNRDFFLKDLLALFQLPADALNVKNFALVNPFQIWMIVVLVSGLNLVGYILSRMLGKTRGLFAIGIFGGLISSTSTVISLAIKAKSDEKLKEDNTNLYAGVALIANAVSFVELLILLAVTSKALLNATLYPILGVLIFGMIIGAYFLLRYSFKHKTERKHGIEINYEPFSIMPAIKFVAIIIIIKLLIQVIELSPLNNLIVPLTALSGFTGVSAPTIAIADLIDGNALSFGLGLVTFLLLNVVNFVSKILFSYFQGTRQFANKVAIGLLLTSIAGLVGLLLSR